MLESLDARAKRIIDEAVELSGLEREACIQRGCSADADLRRRVDVLLAAMDREDTFLSDPEVAVAADATQLRTPLLTTVLPTGTVVDMLRIAPGRAQLFALKDMRLCRHLHDYLQ